MSHAHHFKEVCKECGIVMRQCRCRSEKILVESTCDKCKAEIAEEVTIVPDTKQQLREALAREVYLKSQVKQLTEELEKYNER